MKARAGRSTPIDRRACKRPTFWFDASFSAFLFSVESDCCILGALGFGVDSRGAAIARAFIFDAATFALTDAKYFWCSTSISSSVGYNYGMRQDMEASSFHG